jgi:hybrid cluster-associated redox disulfide protein
MAGGKITKEMVIGDVSKANPAAIKVIQKYFGQGCFVCPGMNMESISFGALMHNIDPEAIVKEINELEDSWVLIFLSPPSLPVRPRSRPRAGQASPIRNLKFSCKSVHILPLGN